MSERGRPAYQPTDKDRPIAEALSGWSIPQDRIARVIGVDPKTLRKHFADELEIGSAKLEAQLAQNLLRIAQGQDRQALIATIFALTSRFGWVETAPPPREPPLGKRRQRHGVPPRSQRATPPGATCLSRVFHLSRAVARRTEPPDRSPATGTGVAHLSYGPGAYRQLWVQDRHKTPFTAASASSRETPNAPHRSALGKSPTILSQIS
jgi:AcrR family transcriptional regulator